MPTFLFLQPKWYRITKFVIVLLCLISVTNASPIIAQSGTGVIRVAPSGNDSTGCGSVAAPCATIQFAVNEAASNDTILVAAGTYIYNAGSDICSQPLGTTGVVCVINKQLTLLGGYDPNDWTNADPTNNLTLIDGQNTYRGIFVASTGPATTLRIEGFTIQNGVARGIAARSGDDQIFAFGGGMFVDSIQEVTLRDMVFKDNQSIGEDAGTTYGGAGAGGGAAIRGLPDNPINTTLERVTFSDNQARGGTGLTRGGYAIGGGLYTSFAVVSGRHLTFTNNAVFAGSTTGSGKDANGELADGQGGGAAIQQGSNATLHYVNAENNRAVGGNAFTDAGGAFGGALFAEGKPGAFGTTLKVVDSTLVSNFALGGNGTNGGLAAGGGLESVNANIILDRVSVINNMATGGNGSTGFTGSPGGGGIYLTRFTGDTTIEITNSIIADNLVEFGASGDTSIGGGGGGIWLQGVEANIVHTTIAGNRLNGASLLGQGVTLLNVGASTVTTANFDYTIIANHTNNNNAATVHILPNNQGVPGDNTANFNRGLWSENTKDNNSDGLPLPSGGIYTGLGTMMSGPANFVSAGPPNYDYHILGSSSAKDQAVGSVTTLDIDNESRTIDTPDIGADEYVPILLKTTIGDGTIKLDWQTNANLVTGVNRYDIIISFGADANPPTEGNSPISVAATETSYQLTGLTNYKSYALQIGAYDINDALIAQSNTVVAKPTDIFIYLPAILK